MAEHPPADPQHLEPILFSGNPVEPGGGNGGVKTPAPGPGQDHTPRLRGLPMVFLSRGAQVYVGDAPFTERTTVDELVNRDEVRMVERRAAKRNEPMPDAFLFFNPDRTEVKLLFWTDLGFTTIHQRLDEGEYFFSRNVSPGEHLSVEELAELLGSRRRVAFSATVPEPAPSWH
ncbi:MAG TPA: IS66 family insertion sequence element accessory protein TnpB [Myxococcales bacterium]|nr:IS66 family insertion sequence element accessory protein TnpB [Myxococcales bacterium]